MPQALDTPIFTQRLILRRFTADDWRDLLEIARAKEASPFADCDTPWPTDEQGIKDAAAYFSTQPNCLAAQVKAPRKVVCFISLNGADDEGALDIGYVMNDAFAGQGYAREALAAVFDEAFDKLKAERVKALWALEDADKLAPLYQLGMTGSKTHQADKFRPGPDGSTAQFACAALTLTKAQWQAKKNV